MSVFSWILLATFGVILTSGYLLLLIQTRHQSNRIEALESQLQVFVDSSIAVAQSVDRLLREGDRGDMANVASRRWLLQEAKMRLSKGEKLLDIATPLGLSRDEVRLLNTQLH